MQNKKITIGLVAVLAVSLCLNVYLYIESQNNKAAITGLQNSYSEKEQQLSDLQEQLSAMTASLEASEGKITELTANLETAEAEKEALTANIETAKAELEALELAKASVPSASTTKTTGSGSQGTTVTQEQITSQTSAEDAAARWGGTVGFDGMNEATTGNWSGDGTHYGDLE